MNQHKPFIIGITGGSGSGKTVFIRAIEEEFTQQEVCVVSMDDYYHPRTQQAYDENGIQNFDLPTSIEHSAMARDIQQLAKGQPVTRQEYVFNNEKATPKMLTFHPAPIIIVEGIFILHYDNIRELLDLKVFIDAREELKIIRRIKRDLSERNYPIDDVLYRYQHHVSPAFLQYIAPYRPIADVIINNHVNYMNGANLLTGFIRSKLNE